MVASSLNLLLSATIFLVIPEESKLSLNHDEKSRPHFHEIMYQIINAKQSASPTTAAAVLRVFFHDCMVGGCDGSTLVASNAFNKAVRDTDINLSLPGDAFDLVTRA
ncbi:hypothetical protein Nepgr_003487 [Nepenthes gracilis]|uniref:peroxidase n=1 Tax=Nepenthes gracilis TaxID=150966 RepID=A0AAD3XDP1_NEPGR|nr:hypothetical protein Nepgr_003487 [Nepenthes gracilis]